MVIEHDDVSKMVRRGNIMKTSRAGGVAIEVAVPELVWEFGGKVCWS